MTGNDPRAALGPVLGYGQIENVVQSIDNALNTAALLQINDRIAGGGHKLAGADDFGVAEIHDAVAIAVRRGLVIDDNGFAVEVRSEFEELAVVGIRRPCRGRSGSLARSGSAHPVEDVFVRDHGCKSVEAVKFAARADASANIKGARCGKLLIAARVIRVHAGINNIANGLGRLRRTDDRIHEWTGPFICTGTMRSRASIRSNWRRDGRGELLDRCQNLVAHLC